MRIALVAPRPSSAASAADTYHARIADGMRAAGHEVSWTEPPAEADAAALLDALPEGVRPVIDGRVLPAFAASAAALAERRAVGLIHHPTALPGNRAEQEREALRATEQRLLPLLSRAIATSEPVAERLRAEFGVEADRVSVVPPGMDALPRSTGSDGSGCAILSVGALIPRKGHDVLLRALARLFDLDWRLTVVGSTERDAVHARTLSALAEELGVGARVRFAGELDDAALEDCWRAADLFALATHWEGYAAPVAAALRRGLPVAVTSGGGAASLVPVEAGVVCPPGDREHLSKALRRVIFDCDLREAMRRAAWKAGEALPSWQAQAEAFARALPA